MNRRAEINGRVSHDKRTQRADKDGPGHHPKPRMEEGVEGEYPLPQADPSQASLHLGRG